MAWWDIKDSFSNLINVDTSSKKSSYIDNTDNSDNSQIINILGSTTGSVGGTTTKKEIKTTATQSDEKPISFAPALIGGGTTTATGNAKASSGIPILPIVAVGGVLGVGLIYFGGKKKKK